MCCLPKQDVIWPKKSKAIKIPSENQFQTVKMKDTFEEEIASSVVRARGLLEGIIKSIIIISTLQPKNERVSQGDRNHVILQNKSHENHFNLVVGNQLLLCFFSQTLVSFPSFSGLERTNERLLLALQFRGLNVSSSDKMFSSDVIPVM